MSTRSRIGILKKDKSVESVYCHSDGYPEYNGYLLNKYYANTNAVNMILALGEFSYLKENLQDCLCYNVWRNEGTRSKVMQTLEEFEKWCEQSDQEYAYLWDEEEEKWIFSPIPWGWTTEEMEEKWNWQDLNDYLIAEEVWKKWSDNVYE